MEDYEVREFRPKRYAKIVDGRVVGIATAGEVECYFIKKRFSDIDTGIIEVSLALTGVAGLVFTLDLSPILKLLSLLAFVLGIAASGVLCWFFILPRIPVTTTRFYEFRQRMHVRKFPYTYNLWLLYDYPLQYIKLLRKGLTLQEQVELGYLNLIACLFAITIIILVAGVK